MKLFLATAILLVLSSDCAAAPLSKNHPIIGIWQVNVPGTTCSETYTFRANGTQTAKSAEEVGESKFMISPTPSAAGYYKLTDTVVKSNGKLDCSGSSTPVGDTVTVYIRFEQSANMFSFCFKEAQDKCVGPFKRISAQASP